MKLYQVNNGKTWCRRSSLVWRFWNRSMNSWRNQRREVSSQVKRLHHSWQFQGTRVPSLDRPTETIKKNTIWEQSLSASSKSLFLNIKIKFFYVLYLSHIAKWICNFISYFYFEFKFLFFCLLKRNADVFPKWKKIRFYYNIRKFLVHIEFSWQLYCVRI